MRLVLATLAAVAALAGIVGAAVVFLGLFDTSARKGHWKITDWAMHTTFENAVAWRADADPPPDLDDPALIELGARHYDSACKMCHAVPGEQASATIAAMVPPPPPITRAVQPWTPQEMHWIVDQGVKMTGMPAWPTAGRKDEVWAVVAFLAAIQRGMDAAGYAALTAPAPQGYCASCHGAQGTTRAPRLDILTPEYIADALAAYRSGARPSGIMAHAVAQIPPQRDSELARALAALPGPADPQPKAPGIGETLAGAGRKGVPACLACHGVSNENPRIPRLDGQGAEYLRAQLFLWRDGHRGGAARHPLMSAAAQDLTDAEIDALADYFARK
ncbi:c-type cytochrome [Paracoccus laeviglucosivorans]|uniref:Cytochrome c553 n=1 Tax=Paracoccus laeviglucosivorans TaxID=1197861 RepID=A0A521FB91_9RHOB|nr:c-type cytochrome [Paracoccus laeviglucosivorans]SMO92800.1 Cytochrome c553 [Paracoccus laeviglucosivorans]